MSTPTAHALTAAESLVLTRRVTTLSVGVAAVLIVIKGAAWLAGGSVAMLASLADSGLDLVASLITFYAVRYAAEPPDAEHRFGHGKAEAFSSLTQGGLVFASAALIGQEAIRACCPHRAARARRPGRGGDGRLDRPDPAADPRPDRGDLKTRSVAVSGDRAHYAADLASNAVSLVGVGAASLLHLAWVDAAAGLIVALWLLWGAIGVFREAAHQLMDHELPLEDRERIIALMTADPRVLGVHQLRTRASGPYMHVQAHMDLDRHRWS
jgi:ferrous-iron efflux pump FieF